MALTLEETKRLDKLNFANGGGYSDFLSGVEKQDPSNDKFLFIGLGGKGCATIKSLKTEVYKKIKCPKGKDKPDNFEYLAIDSDKNSLEQMKKGGLGERGLSDTSQDQEVFGLSNESLVKILKGKGALPENITAWMNPTLSPEYTEQGAKGIRQAGRALLFGSEIKDLWTYIEHKLSNLHSNIQNGQDLNVYVFAGVGGGTGSGTIIDIPYIVREIAEKKGWEVRVYGYIFLPDTYTVEGKSAGHIVANSYAALQEIDMLMNLPYAGGTGKFKAKYHTGYEVESTEAIFKSCVLVSGKRGDGLVPEPDKFSKRVVIDNVISLVGQTKADSDTMLAHSFLDNRETVVRSAVNEFNEKVPRNAYFQYLGIGIGAMELPLDQMMAYVAKGVVDKMEEGWNKHATQQDADLTLRNYGLEPSIVGSQMMQKASLFHYDKAMKKGITKAMVSNGQWYQRIREQWETKNTELFKQWDNERQIRTSAIADNIERDFQARFTEPNFGIYFLKELLASRRVNENPLNGVLERIRKDYYEKGLQTLINGARDGKENALTNMRRIENGHSLFCPFDEYGKACVDSLVWENVEYLYDHYVRECLNEAMADLRKKIEEVEKFISIFEYLKEIVKKNYDMVMAGKMPPHAVYASQLLDFSKSEDDKSVKATKDYLDDLLMQKTSTGLVTTFETKVLEDREKRKILEDKQNGKKEFEAIPIFVNFLENEFAPLVRLSLEQFLTMKYDANTMAEAIKKMCDQLKRDADIIFPSGPCLSISDLPSNNWIIVPADAGQVKTAVENYIASVPDANVATSQDRNSIYWYNLIAGIPLFALKDIYSYEKEYKEKQQNMNKGVHLWETENENWKEFPLLNNRKLWENEGYYDKEEVDYEESVQRDTDCFLKSGLIQEIKENTDNYGFYKAYVLDDVTLEHGSEKILEWCEKTYMQAPHLDENGLIDTKGGLVNAMNQFCKEKGHNMQEVYIQNDSMWFVIKDEAGLYKAMRMQIFLYKKLCKTFELYQKCKNMVDQKNQVLAEAKKLNIDTERFANFVKAGIIQMDEKEALYEASTGNQKSITKYITLESWQKKFVVYSVFKKFCEKTDDRILKELDKDYQTFLKKVEEDDDIAAVFEERGETLVAKADEAVNQLNKVATQNDFATIGKADMPDILIDFYKRLKLYC